MSKTPALKITTFDQGLTRPDGKGGWEIYEKGNDFKFVGRVQRSDFVLTHGAHDIASYQSSPGVL